MKTKLITLIAFMIAGLNIAFGAEKVPPAQEKSIESKNEAAVVKLPPKDSAQYWVLRSQTLTEFIPLLTKKRTEFENNAKLMSQYLEKSGKKQEFLDSKIKSPDSPELYAKAVGIADRMAKANIEIPEKSLTWEEAVELAMRLILNEGYLPADVSGEDELNTMKKICQQQETYGEKIRKELHGHVQKCMDIWFYLETLGKQQECKEYVRLEKEKQQKAEQERIANEEVLAAAGNMPEKQTSAETMKERQNRLLWDKFSRYRY
jgi:hypothetical protein